VWEAVHILDALLKHRSEIQPDTLHADTQGQSEPVFGLCRSLGIKLMPRMRGLSDAVFYRPSKAIRYQHIDALFGGEIDWDLIATHARDMFQVALSIQAGRVMPSMLLQKLGSYSRHSLLYRAFRELGRVERTLFLPRFISSVEVRRTIRAETTKIEAFNDFLDWVSFGGPCGEERRPCRAGEAAQIRQLGRQHDHAVQRRRHDGRVVVHGRGPAPRYPWFGRLPQPLRTRAHPPLRSLRTGHERLARAAGAAAAPLRAGLVTTFYTYSQPTPTSPTVPCRRAGAVEA